MGREATSYVRNYLCDYALAVAPVAFPPKKRIDGLLAKLLLYLIEDFDADAGHEVLSMLARQFVIPNCFCWVVPRP